MKKILKTKSFYYLLATFVPSVLILSKLEGNLFYIGGGVVMGILLKLALKVMDEYHKLFIGIKYSDYSSRHRILSRDKVFQKQIMEFIKNNAPYLDSIFIGDFLELNFSFKRGLTDDEMKEVQLFMDSLRHILYINYYKLIF